MTKLINCPFCGDNDLFVGRVGDGRSDARAVTCNKCDAEGPTAVTRNEAKALWNARRAGYDARRLRAFDTWVAIMRDVQQRLDELGNETELAAVSGAAERPYQEDVEI